MADVNLNPVFENFRRKIGDLVFYTRKGDTFVRRKGMTRNPKTEAQMAVRNAFSSLVVDWRQMNGVMHRSWEHFAKGKKYSGYNAFLASNVERRKGNLPMELFKALGEERLIDFSAEKGASEGEVTCRFTMPQGSAEKHVTFFSRKKLSVNGDSRIIRTDGGANPASPVTISGLERGAEYEIHAVISDAQYASATKVSESLSGSAIAGGS